MSQRIRPPPCAAGVPADDGVHDPVPEPDRAGAAVSRCRSRRPRSSWDDHLEHDHRSARRRVVPAERRRVADRSAGQRRVRLRSRRGCWCATTFPARRHRRRADRPAVRAADGGRRHHADGPLRAERLAGPAARRATASRSPSRRSASRSRSSSSACRSSSARCSRSSRISIRRSRKRRRASARAASTSSTRVILPYLFPAWLTGFALAFARAVGEYGSVVFISGNMPMRDRDLAAAHHHQAGAVRLRGRDGDRARDAADVVPAAPGDQRASALERPQPGELSIWLVPSNSGFDAARRAPAI